MQTANNEWDQSNSLPCNQLHQESLSHSFAKAHNCECFVNEVVTSELVSPVDHKCSSAQLTLCIQGSLVIISRGLHLPQHPCSPEQIPLHVAQTGHAAGSAGQVL